MRKVDLSAIITAHDEGLILHKTMRSVFEALEKVKEAGYSYEVIVHVDNGDEITLKYLNRYKNDKRVRILQNSFGDLGSSRNYAAKCAKGTKVAFMDGDDLISPNWFLKALKMVEASKRDIIVHPEAILTFGVNQSNILTIQRDSKRSKKEAVVLASANMWCSVAFAQKELFIRNPYRKLGNGYCYEDWIFNIETVEKGIPHRVASNTVLFYRRSDSSMLSSNNREGAVIPAMDMFSFRMMAAVKVPDSNIEHSEEISDINEIESEEEIMSKGKCYRMYKKVRNNDFLNFFITPVAKTILKITGRLPKESVEQVDLIEQEKERKIVPDYVVNEWKNANHVEPILYPFSSLIDGVTLYDAEAQSSVGLGYCKLAKMVKKKPDYIFIVPWVVRGGADKVLFNYIDAFKERHPEWHFAVISTLPVENSWADKLPEFVDFIDFGNVAAELWSDQARDDLMSRLIVQLECKKIHIINSEFGYLWIKKHKKLIESEYCLDVSIFAWGYIDGEECKAVGSYANPYLFEIYSVVRNIFTDNQNMIDYLAEVNGFDRNKMKVLYQPIRNLEVKLPHDGLCDEGKIRIIWAGRVTSVKMPNIVAEIGRYMDVDKVTIDVYGEIDETVDKDIFDDIPALKYCGVYNGFDSLPISEYDLLLYTSLSDGMPNVILEATAGGLPILASNDGGVGEFIQNWKTGILVEDYRNHREYVKLINEIYRNPKKLDGLAKSAQKLLQERHSWQRFMEMIAEYF